MKQITIEPAIKEWLIQALKESHHDETVYHQEALTCLQAELKKIKHCLDQLYVDKLDGKVPEKFWLEKSSEWQLEQDRILSHL